MEKAIQVIKGRVVYGKQLGRTMGFPTANLSFGKGLLIPAHGVYVATIRIGRRNYTGICNVGGIVAVAFEKSFSVGKQKLPAAPRQPPILSQ